MCDGVVNVNVFETVARAYWQPYIATLLPDTTLILDSFAKTLYYRQSVPQYYLQSAIMHLLYRDRLIFPMSI